MENLTQIDKVKITVDIANKMRNFALYLGTHDYSIQPFPTLRQTHPF